MLPQHYGRNGALWRCSEYLTDLEECLRHVRAVPSECWVERQKLGLCVRGRDLSIYGEHRVTVGKVKAVEEAVIGQLNLEAREEAHNAGDSQASKQQH